MQACRLFQQYLGDLQMIIASEKFFKLTGLLLAMDHESDPSCFSYNLSRQVDSRRASSELKWLKIGEQ